MKKTNATPAIIEGSQRRQILLTQLRKLTATTGIEIFGVGVGALSGFVIVQYLPKAEYAQYTFIVACIAFAVGLSDLGLSHCYLPVVGSRANDADWVLKCCHRIYRTRWLLFGCAGCIVIPYFWISSERHAWIGSTYLLAAVCGAVLIASSVREQVFRQMLLIMRKNGAVNRINFYTSSARLIFTALAVGLLYGPWLLPALLVVAVGVSFFGLFAYHAQPDVVAFGHSRLEAKERRKVDAMILKIVTPLLIPNLFYQFQNAISIFLVALFASSNSVAEVGALTRPVIILVVVDRVTGALLFPLIARSEAGIRLKIFVFRVHALYLLSMTLLFLSAWFFPGLWILLIGKQYAGQQQLIWMVFLAAILMNASGFAGTSLTSRGMTRGQLFLLPVVLISQVIYLLAFGVHDTVSSIQFSIATATVFFLYEYFMLWLLFFRDR